MSERLQVLAVANFKGGASKTTTSAHLGQFLAMRGYRVLLIDCDSQGSLTGIFGLVPDVEIQGEHTLLPVFEGTTSTLDGLIRKTYWPGLDLVPASLGLYQSEFLLPVRQLRDRSLRFWTILADAIQSVADAYDVVVCDCPPSLGYLSINAVCAATSVLVPVPPSMLDYSSTGAFLQMIIEVFEKARRSNPNLGNFDFFKLMVARFKSDDRNQQEVVKALRKTAGELLLNRAMALTTGIDAAGNRKQTFYEIKASEFPGTRKTYLRALQQLNLLNYEIENLLLQVWGRAPVLDDQTSIAAQ
jgi:chromosome partitioning protein